MFALHEQLAHRIAAWRTREYETADYPAIGEILEWASGTEEGGNTRFLRTAQLRALETYWYLRLVETTPKIPALYERLFEQPADLLSALGLTDPRLTRIALNSGSAALLTRVRNDDELVREFKLQALRETLGLDYPSYILALAMGAGKTLLIGAIIASEFAMALEYPDGPFVQNALVFAPGKTILESLRELLAAPYHAMLPPRLHKPFAASVKLTFTRDGDPDVPVIPGSSFNVVVTNTEKIRIRSESVTRGLIRGLLADRDIEEARREVANARLQKIASLPHLAVFSDEAHHTYGQALDTELKKVRKTVDYLAASTNLIAVVNTTGTPYFRRQLLRDVVIWYGLSQGIREGILKEVSGNIQSFDFGGNAAEYVDYVVRDFFRDYRDVALPDGSVAKLAIYFPQTDDLAELRPHVDAALAKAGVSPAVCLVNTSDTTLTKEIDIEAFNRLNDPASPHRVILLVNKGTEGWNCPSLFACALARRLRSSNNFVLQAATRCLRQVPGNVVKARIYLSSDNFRVLEQQLRETYGEELSDINRTSHLRRRLRVVLRKPDIPPLVLKEIVRRVVRIDQVAADSLSISRPQASARTAARTRFTVDDTSGRRGILRQHGVTETIERETDEISIYAASVELANVYKLNPLALVDRLRAVYLGDTVPAPDVASLATEIESQVRRYEVHEEHVERALALVRPEGFDAEQDQEGAVVYVTEITYPVDREPLLARWDEFRAQNQRDVGFVMDPLEFDSKPEYAVFAEVLRQLNLQAWEVEDFLFTGALTDPAKTDFFVEYRDTSGKPRRYTPDFVIRKRPAPGEPSGSGRVYIVEVKAMRDREDDVNGENGAKAMAVRALERVNEGRLKYEIIFTSNDTVTHDQLRNLWKFAEEREPYLPIDIDRDRLAAWCHKWNVQRLELFGSILRSDFGPHSDVDFLVTFAPEARWGLEFVHMAEELETIVGRRVDLLTRRSVERSANWMRRKSILHSARTMYVA